MSTETASDRADALTLRNHTVDLRNHNVDEQFAELAATVKRIDESTAEIVEIFKALKGWFRVVGWFGKLIEWSVKIGAGLAAVWVVLIGLKAWLKP